MSQLMFSCPHCAAELECEERFGGREMQCPTCQGILLTPQTQPQAAPPRGSASRRGGSSHQSTRGASAKKAGQKKESGGSAKVLKIVAVVAFLIVGGYFGFGYASKWQAKLNEKQAKLAKNSDGGELGHIANVYAVLDATDPSKHENEFYGTVPGMVGGRDLGASLGLADPEAARKAMCSLPVVPPAYSLDANAAVIPKGKVNGTISGTNFVVNAALVGLAQPYHMLSVRQGEGAQPDLELRVFFLVKSGETLAGHTITVASNETSRTLPKVTKCWKTNPKYAPRQKTYSSGYSLVLEFGEPKGTYVPGQMYLALPDEEKTVVAGQFNADLLRPSSQVGGGDY